jgi:nickel superoxide dismutase
MEEWTMKSGSSKKLILLITLVSLILFGSLAYSHCQIPCGIYDDQMRIGMIAEHIKTIEKSMNQINELSSQDKPDMNQLVRWIQNKEHHADELSDIITYYFMAQRIKLPQKDNQKDQDEYVKKLVLLHKMLVYTMNSKQTTDLKTIEKLRSLSAEFKVVYTSKSG